MRLCVWVRQIRVLLEQILIWIAPWTDVYWTGSGLGATDSIFGRTEVLFDRTDMNLEPLDIDLETLWQF